MNIILKKAFHKNAKTGRAGFHKKPTKQDGTHMTIRSQITIPTSIFPTTHTIIPYSFWNGCVYLCVVNSRIGLWGLWVGVCIVELAGSSCLAGFLVGLFLLIARSMYLFIAIEGTAAILTDLCTYRWMTHHLFGLFLRYSDESFRRRRAALMSTAFNQNGSGFCQDQDCTCTYNK